MLQWISLCTSTRQNHTFNTAQTKHMITWKFARYSHTSVWETTAMYLTWSKQTPDPSPFALPGTPPAFPFACISHHSLCLQVACVILLSLNNVNIHSNWLLSYQPTFLLCQSTSCYFLLTLPGSKLSLGVLILRAPMLPGRSPASQPSHSVTLSKVFIWLTSGYHFLSLSLHLASTMRSSLLPSQLSIAQLSQGSLNTGRNSDFVILSSSLFPFWSSPAPWLLWSA